MKSQKGGWEKGGGKGMDKQKEKGEGKDAEETNVNLSKIKHIVCYFI